MDIAYLSNDEEAHQYWDHQLPDDITPDFKVMGGDDTQGINGLSFSSLSLNDISESSRFSASTEYPSPTGFQHSLPQPWDKQIVNDDLLLGNVHEGPQYNGNSIHAFLSDMPNEQILLDNTDANPIDFLASQFRGFAAESLAEVYFASGGDLNLTIEMLTQLELQVDGGFIQNPNSQALSTPNLSALDFPALSGADGQNGLPKFAGDDLQQNSSPYQSLEKESALLFRSSSSIASRDAIDFASAVRKMLPQESSIWKYSTNGSSIASIGSSRSSQVPISSYNSGQGRSIYGDRLQNRGSARLAPTWLETGEAVANMYSELREEARDHARLRNACFEQVCRLSRHKKLGK
ncbi:polyadenylate-binding protein-interacting protein 7-like [Olea europaea var. sylvestris]|uniref:polyadenylate-binding protein-interacting protein 7-like n=1 Tax=Olea europaea var. sylvestris TaxID=158386 RepID=UPI000C1D586D|nr:polyadenylate-binding protein-interacting protein 7-like [Olea europaea var. sylvestris]